MLQSAKVLFDLIWFRTSHVSRLQIEMKNLSARFRPVRVLAAVFVFALVIVVGWIAWEPGVVIVDGRHDRGHNGIWLQHGWLGDDEWFIRNSKDDQIPHFRNTNQIAHLAALLRTNGISDVYPHLCPCSIDGNVAPADPAQVERFLDGFQGFRVMPWVGGVLGAQARIHNAKWRESFVGSITNLLKAHSRLAGVHLNIEPLSSGNTDYLRLLDEVKAALPSGKLLSVAAYPPPTRWQPVPDVHWDQQYFREVARRCDQLVVMMYDTALFDGKLYRGLMSSWTREVLAWSEGTQCLLGAPAYDDFYASYHDPKVENLKNALRGIHGGLGASSMLPKNYQGVAIYSDWEMDADEWETWRKEFRMQDVAHPID